MMRWPWSKRETRQSDLGTLIGQEVLGAAGVAPLPSLTATGALEAGTGQVSRAFASAEVDGPAMLIAPLTPSWLAAMARSLIRVGEWCALVRVRRGRLTLLPASSWNVEGGADPDDWRYRLYLTGPSLQTTLVDVPAYQVVHVMYGWLATAPWRGLGPLQFATLAGTLSAETVGALADESGTTRGYVLPMPIDGNDPTLAQLKADLKALRGRLTTVESTGRNWDAGGAPPPKEWEPRRLGPSPPEGLVELMSASSREVLAAIGVNPILLVERGDGAALREAWRELLFGTVAPLGRIVAAELSAKLDAPISLDWSELRASDIAGRTRSFKQLVESGVHPADAASNTGIVLSRETRDPTPAAPGAPEPEDD